nr:MAG TPA: hypothetical protein [Caudoviricetes sp.]
MFLCCKFFSHVFSPACFCYFLKLDYSLTR